MPFRPFSYDDYSHLIRALKEISPLKDFADIKPSDKAFFILRHDVEFSVERAFELAQFEHNELNITSSYFFQIRNNTYNVLSRQNIDLVKKIHNFGHAIGLHVNYTGLATVNEINSFIQQDAAILSQILNIKIDRFSFHRPTPQLLLANISIDGLINVYGKNYFQYAEKANHHDQNIHYFSDSQHQWKYGHPSIIAEKKSKKFQLLVHPYSWTSHGWANTENFKKLIELKYATLLGSINEECHHFPQELLHEKL